MFGIKTKEDNGLDIENWDAPIYRVYSIKWFKKLLQSKSNGLVHPSMWDDPFENFFLKCNAIDVDGTLVSLESLSEDWYGQCWTKNKDSDAMWRIYSPEKDGIRVTTTIRTLFNSFYDSTDSFASHKYFIGSVGYVEKTEIENFIKKTAFSDLAIGGQSDAFARTLCVKRLEFAHENEIRLLFQDVGEKKKGANRVANFSLDPSIVFSEIALDPRMTPDEFERVKQELCDCGCVLPISQSELYKLNEITIRL